MIVTYVLYLFRHDELQSSALTQQKIERALEQTKW